MCIEYGFGKSAGLEQSETQQYRVPHNTPQGCDDVLGESDTLNENGIDANADKDEESLEADGKQGAQIVLSDLRLLPVAKGGERDGG